MLGSLQIDPITTPAIDRYLTIAHMRGGIMTPYVESRIAEATAVTRIQSEAHSYGIDISCDSIRAYLDAAALSHRMRLYLIAHWALNTDVPPDAADMSEAALREGCDVSRDDADTFLGSVVSFIRYVHSA